MSITTSTSPAMDDYTKRELFGPLGDVDPLPPSLLKMAPAPEQAKTLALLQDISRDFSPLVSHTALLRAIAERIKRLVNYDVFTSCSGTRTPSSCKPSSPCA